MAYFGQNITVGVLNDVPGFSAGDTNLAGFDIDLMNEFGKKLGRPMLPSQLDVKARDEWLTGGNNGLIVIATYSITEARRSKGVDFAGPYMVTPLAFLIRADDSSITTTDSLSGKRVCVTEGGTAALAQIGNEVRIYERSKNKDCVEDLRGSPPAADAVFTDEVILYGYAAANPNRFRVVMSGTVGSNQYYGVGLRGGNPATCEKLNEVIDEFVRTRWVRAFEDQLPAATAAYAGNDPPTNFQSKFKPQNGDMARLSCQLDQPLP